MKHEHSGSPDKNIWISKEKFLLSLRASQTSWINFETLEKKAREEIWREHIFKSQARVHELPLGAVTNSYNLTA